MAASVTTSRRWRATWNTGRRWALTRYRKWLEGQYGTIDKLNALAARELCRTDNLQPLLMRCAVLGKRKTGQVHQYSMRSVATARKRDVPMSIKDGPIIGSVHAPATRSTAREVVCVKENAGGGV